MQEWCDENLRLSALTTHQAGQWDTMKFPYQRGIMYLWSHHKVTELNLQWATRMSKTELTKALCAWSSANDPGPTMIAGPDEKHMREFADKFYRTLENCHVTNDLLLPEHKRRFPKVDLRQMLVYFAWAGSVTSLADKGIRYLYQNELDKWPYEVSNEADKQKLSEERTGDWPPPLRKIFRESTPSIKGISRIEKAMENSDVILHYHVPCPHCGKFQVLDFKQIKWDKLDGKNDPAHAHKTARYECCHCSKIIADYQRLPMLQKGVWAPPEHKVPKGCERLVLWGSAGPCRRVGTWLPALYSPTKTWGEMADKFLCDKRDGDLQNWENAWMAQAWSVEYDVPEWETLQKAIGVEIPSSIVPAWAVVLTAGIDVHKYKNHCVVLAWGPGGRCHLVDFWITEDGATIEQRIDSAVDTVMARSFMQEGGKRIEVRIVSVDSGYEEDHVHGACKPYGPRAIAIKGATSNTGARAPIVVSIVSTDKKTGKKPKRGKGKRLFILNSPYWKDIVNSMLLRNPKDEAAFTLHENADENFLRGICNVAKIPVKTTGGGDRPTHQVVDRGIKDHVHDATCYAVAAADWIDCRAMSVKPSPTKRKPPQERQPSRFGRHESKGFGSRRR